MKSNKIFLVANNQKCGCCNWQVTNLYLMARNQRQANQLLKEYQKQGGNALCGNCMTELLSKYSYNIIPKLKTPKK